jgi:DnaJ-class molecular chaperone
MSDETDDTPESGPRACQACRGTGQVISNLGGSTSSVKCPWCEGSGVFIAEHDAQARWTQGSSGAA